MLFSASTTSCVTPVERDGGDYYALAPEFEIAGLLRARLRADYDH